MRWHSRGIAYTQEITAACRKSGSFRRGLAFEKLPSLLHHELEKVTTANEEKKIKLNTVPLNWKEVYYTNCPLVSASNVDQELGWTKAKEDFKKIGAYSNHWKLSAARIRERAA